MAVYLGKIPVGVIVETPSPPTEENISTMKTVDLVAANFDGGHVYESSVKYDNAEKIFQYLAKKILGGSSG